jgi:hypothetical protein
MLNIILFIIGFILSVIGLFFILLYLNLFVIGYSFLEFVYFIIRSIYCDLFFIGIILLFISLGRIRKK